MGSANSGLPEIVPVFGADPAAGFERLHRARSRMRPEHCSLLPPFTDGWHGSMFADGLAVGEVTTDLAVGREVVLFRGEDGIPRALAAVARRLLTILDAIVRDGTEWRAAQQA